MGTEHGRGRDLYRVRVPGSKSISHRMLIAAALAEGESVIRGFHPCEDTLLTLEGLRAMGVDIAIAGDGEVIRVRGNRGRFPECAVRRVIELGNSGTSMRLLMSVAAAARGETLLTGGPRMCERPVGPLVSALSALGAEAVCIRGNNRPPVLVRSAGLRGGRITLPGGESSQYASSLLLSGPYAGGDIRVDISGEPVSMPYVELTLKVMEMFGVKVGRISPRSFLVPAGGGYKAGDLQVEGDVSSAAYFWAAAAVTGKTVATENIDPYETAQGDIAFLQVLESMGCRVKRHPRSVEVTGGRLRPVEVDMSQTPDMVPTAAAVALFCPGATVIRKVAHLRFKESDRLRAISTEWRKLGADVEELPDGLVIKGGRPLHGARVSPHGDHRIAMSLAAASLRIPGVRIAEPEVVEKSFPSFWRLWAGAPRL